MIVRTYVAFAHTGEQSIYGSVVSVQFEVDDPEEDETGDGDAATDGTGSPGDAPTTGDLLGDETSDMTGTAAMGDDGNAPAGCTCNVRKENQAWLALVFELLVACRRRTGKQSAPVRRCRPRWGHRRTAGRG